MKKKGVILLILIILYFFFANWEENYEREIENRPDNIFISDEVVYL